MSQLNASGMRERLDELVLEKKIPVIGICVGMQMMGNRSDEGKQEGLKWIDSEILKFDENFGQYSYLEDLDFSLNLKNFKKKIVISYLAKFTHPNNIDRSSLIFGITEVMNRFRVVKKHKLNLYYFFIVSLIRFIISFTNSLYFNRQYFLRAIGNVFGFFYIITSLFKTSKIK